MSATEDVDAFLIATAGIPFDAEWMRVADAFFRADLQRYPDWVRRKTVQAWIAQHANAIALWSYRHVDGQ